MQEITINGVVVRMGQVWVTKSGNLALIVELPELYDKFASQPAGLGFLWFDDIDGNFTVCNLAKRLGELTELTSVDFFVGLIAKAEQYRGLYLSGRRVSTKR